MDATAQREIGNLKWTYVLVGATDATLLPYVPLYLAQRGLSAPAIGVVLAVAAAATFATGVGWAQLADRRFSPERMVVGACLTAALLALLLPVSRGAAMLSAVFVALSVARAPFTLLDPITLRKLRDTPRTDYARIRLRMSAGWAASAIASGWLFQATGLHVIPFIYASLSVLLGVWIYRALKPFRETPAVEPGAQPAQPVRVSRVPVALVTFLLSCLLLGISLAATQNFLVLQINVLGGGALLIGAASAFQAMTEIPTMGYTHVLTKYLRHRALFAIGCAIYLAIFVAWAFTGSALVAAVLRLAAGVAFALTLVSAVMITNDLVPARLRATGQALMKAVLFGLAPIIGASGGGLVYGTLGARAMFLSSTVVVGAAGLLALIVAPSRERRTTVTEPAASAAGASQ